MKALLIVLLCASPASAQSQVRPWADWTSYGTAAINPTIAFVDAWQSSDQPCRLKRLALSEAVGNGLALTLKHFVVSPRPCLGCAPDGFPSGHTMNSTIGMSAKNWQFGLGVAVLTGGLRMTANRHTPRQAAAGLFLGLGAEAVGHVLFRCQ